MSLLLLLVCHFPIKESMEYKDGDPRFGDAVFSCLIGQGRGSGSLVVNTVVACNAKGDEVFLASHSQSVSGSNVVDLQVCSDSTLLTTASVAFQNGPVQLPIGLCA